MSRICSKCQQSSTIHEFVCSHCGVELVDNGELLTALDLNEISAKPKILPLIVGLIVVAITLFITKLLL